MEDIFMKNLFKNLIFSLITTSTSLQAMDLDNDPGNQQIICRSGNNLTLQQHTQLLSALEEVPSFLKTVQNLYKVYCTSLEDSTPLDPNVLYLKEFSYSIQEKSGLWTISANLKNSNSSVIEKITEDQANAIGAILNGIIQDKMED
jgi:hypothetical protein